jgi:hypothetical protein
MFILLTLAQAYQLLNLITDVPSLDGLRTFLEEIVLDPDEENPVPLLNEELVPLRAVIEEIHDFYDISDEISDYLHDIELQLTA